MSTVFFRNVPDAGTGDNPAYRSLRLPALRFAHHGPSTPALPAAFRAAVLSHQKGGALGLAGFRSPVSHDPDPFRLAAALPVVDAVDGLAVDLQAAFRRLEQVIVRTVAALVEASAARLIIFSRLASVHDDRLLTAAVLRVVQAVCYAAFQFRHGKVLLHGFMTGRPGIVFISAGDFAFPRQPSSRLQD